MRTFKNIIYVFVALLFTFQVKATATQDQELDNITSSMNKISLSDNIPDEVLVETFDYLDGKDIRTVKKVCRKFRILASDSSLLIPSNDREYCKLIESKPQLALKRIFRMPPKILIERNNSLAKTLMITKLPETNPEFLKRWRNYVFLTFINHQFESNDLYDQLQQTLEVAKERFENFDIVFSNLSCADQFLRRNALWEQLAYADDIKREELIKLYRNGSDQHLPKDETKAQFLIKYGEMIQTLLLKISVHRSH